MSAESTQIVLMETGGFARVTFVPAGRGRIRILEVAYSEDENADDSDWEILSMEEISRDDVKYLLRQLDLSELGLHFT